MLMALTFFMGVSLSAFSQFEGVIAYSIEYSTDDAHLKNMLESFPDLSYLYLKGNMSKFEQSTSGGGVQSFISNHETGDMTLVMQFLGSAFKVRMSHENIKDLEQVPAKAVFYDEYKKEIGGVNCSHAYTLENTDTLHIYYTKTIASGNIIPELANLDGTPLYYETVKKDIRMTYSAQEIKETQIPATEFEIPSNIRELPFDDFARSFAVVK